MLIEINFFLISEMVKCIWRLKLVRVFSVSWVKVGFEMFIVEGIYVFFKGCIIGVIFCVVWYGVLVNINEIELRSFFWIIGNKEFILNVIRSM